MEQYKELLLKFAEEIEKIDEQCDYEKLSDEEQYLFWIIRACRNKLIDVHNKIGDEDWVMPDMKLRI